MCVNCSKVGMFCGKCGKIVGFECVNVEIRIGFKIEDEQKDLGKVTVGKMFVTFY